MARTKTTNGSTTGANLEFEAKLWGMADELRGSVDASEYGRRCRERQFLPT